MPTYEYVCGLCGRVAEQIRPWSDRDQPARCGAGGCKGHLTLSPAEVKR